MDRIQGPRWSLNHFSHIHFLELLDIHTSNTYIYLHPKKQKVKVKPTLTMYSGNGIHIPTLKMECIQV